MARRSRAFAIAFLVLATVALAIAGVFRRYTTGSLPLRRSPLLAEIVEPISIQSGMSFSDGGSLGLQFADARGIVRFACLQNSLEGGRDLFLGSFIPEGVGGHRVPISGIDERAFLGLLERWSIQDPDAGVIQDRQTRFLRGEIDVEEYHNVLTPAQREKGIAFSMLIRLRQRNGLLAFPSLIPKRIK